MTDTIVHLDKEQTRIQRRKLLANDVYVLFCDYLKQLHKEGQTALSQIEVFLSASNFAHLLMSLSNIKEGIDDELDELEEDAEGKNDAMIISMVATAIMCAVRNRNSAFDYRFAIIHIYTRWNDHALLAPMLQAAARKEEARWMEGKKTDLLTCELKETLHDNGNLDEAKAVVSDIVDNCMGLTAESIERIMLPIMATNDQHNHAFDEQINRLKEKLNIKTTTQLHIDKQYNTACQQFMGKMENPKFIAPQQDETV